MCGRVVGKVDFPTLQRTARARSSRRAQRFSKSYNIGPGCFQAALVHSHSRACRELPEEHIVSEDCEPSRTLMTMRWGITLASQSQALKGSPQKFLINVRAESINSKFPRWAESQRCIVLISGYYEWRGSDHKPHYVYPKDCSTLSLAAVFDISDDGEAHCAVITKPAEPHLQWLHHRMPCCVQQKDVDLWIDPEKPFSACASLLTESAVDLCWHEVSEKVNKPGTEGADCCLPIAEYRKELKSRGIERFFKPVAKRKREDAELTVDSKRAKVEEKEPLANPSEDTQELTR